MVISVGTEECSRRGSNKRMKRQHEKWRDARTLDNESPIQAVCGKAARTDLGGGRAMKRTSLPLLRRREFILALGAAATWLLEARAQQRMRRVGVLLAAYGNRSSRPNAHRGVQQHTAKARLERRPQYPVRLSLGWRRHCQRKDFGRRLGAIRAGRNRCRGRSGGHSFISWQARFRSCSLRSPSRSTADS